MIKIEHTTERIESIAGLPLAGKLISRMGVTSIISKLKKGAGNILVHMLGALVQGNTRFESLRDVQDDPVFKEALEVEKVFSPETVRLYLEQMIGDVDSILKQLQTCNVRLLEKASLSGVKVGTREMIPVDIDTSPMDNSKTKKEKIGYTYKGFVGYHPLFAYIGAEGYMIASELRPGSQHCQKGTPEFIGALCADIAAIGLDKPAPG
ncbi:hypothetical protein FACS1894137_18020 [Spirochaetia bacterium]|nr:hypothetical protein FACS1894137_18020 [Spirochaetia bacterium]